MKNSLIEKEGRYILFLDILGFTELIKRHSPEEVFRIIEEALNEFNRWEGLNGSFRTLYFSDTFIFYQEPKGYGDWAFLDIYALGGMIMTSLLAKGIATRGAISFGEFEVRGSTSQKHQMYFGEALIEACKAEKEEKWVGTCILNSAWAPYEKSNPGIIKVFEGEGVWKIKDDSRLLLNPFIKLRSYYASHLLEDGSNKFGINEIEIDNDLKAFRYLHKQLNKYSSESEESRKIYDKYFQTIEFIKEIFGKDMYKWCCEVGDI